MRPFGPVGSDNGCIENRIVKKRQAVLSPVKTGMENSDKPSLTRHFRYYYQIRYKQLPQQLQPIQLQNLTLLSDPHQIRHHLVL